MLFPSVNRQKSWLSFLLFVAIVLNLYFYFSIPGPLEERAHYLDSLFGRTFVPIQKIFNLTERSITDGFDKIGRLWKADIANQNLLEEMQVLKMRLQGLENLESENQHFRKLLGFRESQNLNFIAAKIISRDVSSYFGTIEIDRGEDSGLSRLMPVVCPDGLVGRITHVRSSSSTVLLITDPSSKVDAIAIRSRTSVIVGGSSKGGLNLRYLPRRRDLKEGDLVVTSGLNTYFPAGFKIGVIIGTAKDPHFVLEEAELEPSVDFDSLEDVFVIVSRK